MVRESHDDDHYANAIYKYAWQYAIDIRELAYFICTDEPGFPLSVLPRVRRVLVGKNEVYQVGDHDFSTILIATVILLNTIPETVDGSLYQGKPMVSLKISPTDPSSALKNAKEIANVLIEQYGSKENIPYSPYLIYRRRT